MRQLQRKRIQVLLQVIKFHANPPLPGVDWVSFLFQKGRDPVKQGRKHRSVRK